MAADKGTKIRDAVKGSNAAFDSLGSNVVVAVHAVVNSEAAGQFLTLSAQREVVFATMRELSTEAVNLAASSLAETGIKTVLPKPTKIQRAGLPQAFMGQDKVDADTLVAELTDLLESCASDVLTIGGHVKVIAEITQKQSVSGRPSDEFAEQHEAVVSQLDALKDQLSVFFQGGQKMPTGGTPTLLQYWQSRVEHYADARDLNQHSERQVPPAAR